MEKVVITPKKMMPPLATYSPGLRCGSMLYISGMLSLDEAGEIVGKGDAAAQTEQVIKNLQLVLEEAGGTLQNIVMMNIFVSDFEHYAEMNKVYAKYFSEQPPARYCVSAGLVAPEFFIEMAATAILKD